MNVIDKSSDNGLVFGLLYGGSGTGKTHFVGTLGELGRVLVIDVDKGYRTLVSEKTVGLTQEMRDNITIVTFDSFADLNEAYKLVLANDPKEWSKKFDTGITEKFDWIVWDTWSELQWHMHQELRKKEKLQSPNLGKDLAFRQRFGIQHWGDLTDLNKLAIEQLRDCTKLYGTCNQFVLMQESITQDAITNAVTKGPSIHGKLLNEFPAYFDDVLRSYVAPDGNWAVTTQPKSGWPAKKRGDVGKEYKNPTAKQLYG